MYFFKHKNYLSLISGVIILLLFPPLEGVAQPNWPVIQTADNHTIIVKVDIGPTIDGNPLEVGDYIGVFYEDNGTLACGGQAEWTGVDFAFSAYGDDGSTAGVKDGFQGGEAFKWKIWQASTNTEFEATATYKPIGGIISHEGTYSTNGISSLNGLNAMGTPGNEPDWEVVPTIENHTIIVPSNVQSKIDGEPFQDGDYFGAFYINGAGEEKCAGYGVWDGNDLAFSVYGSDQRSALAKNGYNVGEEFAWKAYKASTGETHDLAMVTYIPVGGFYSHTNLYAHNGISGIAGAFTSIEQHNINIHTGWNMISSYIDPIQPEMEQIFSQSSHAITLVKNEGGEAYIPSLNVNQIGTWNYLNGYLVKASQDVVVTLYGTTVDPSTPLDIPAGWSIIPYLSSEDKPLTEALASIIPFINEMKDIEGNSFIPFWDINQIGNLEPGKAYKIFLTAPQTLVLPQNAERRVPTPQIKSIVRPTTFVMSPRGSVNNATLAIPVDVADQFMKEGDEIGVFTTEGVLVGSSIFQGEHMALNLQGDEPETLEIEGLINGETLVVKIWNKKTGNTQNIQLELENKAPVYQQDELLIARSIAPQKMWDLSILNNPAHEVIRLQIHTPEMTDVQLEIRNQLGQLVKAWTHTKNTGGREIEIPSNQLTAGIYYIRLITDEKSIVKKLLLTK